MPKCLACKVDNSIAEFKKRQNVTAFMAARNQISKLQKALEEKRYQDVASCDRHLTPEQLVEFFERVDQQTRGSVMIRCPRAWGLGAEAQR